MAFTKAKTARRLRFNTPDEDARITAAALSDPDALPVTDAELEQFFTRVGRPKSLHRKQSTTIRLDADVINAFKAAGPGWQTRMNDALKEWLDTHPA